MPEVLQFKDVAVELTFKPIKNVHLRVHPPLGRVTLSAPLDMDKEHLRVYVSSKLGWIRREQKKITAQEREPEHLFITRESHYLFGKRYLLQVTESEGPPKVVLHHSKIELIIPADSPVEYKKEILYKWYRTQLRTVLKGMIEQYSKTIGVHPENFGIHKVRTKWGSCNDTARSIWFNIELAKKPKECIEYVVVHELVHLKERTHNKHFVMLMNTHLPNWQVRKRLLNELPV